MAQNNTPVRALVLAGGGARGSYQVAIFLTFSFLRSAFCRLCVQSGEKPDGA